MVYVIPLIIIVSLVTIKRSKSKLTEWQSRVLKLFSGLMVCMLGLVLLINPVLLKNVFSVVWLSVISLGLTAVVSFVWKKYKGKDM